MTHFEPGPVLNPLKMVKMTIFRGFSLKIFTKEMVLSSTKARDLVELALPKASSLLVPSRTPFPELRKVKIKQGARMRSFQQNVG